MSKNLFGKNLRELCARQGSVAAVCREIGINRQQFNRYLIGQTRPSAHVMAKIEDYFGISAAELYSPSRPNSLHLNRLKTEVFASDFGPVDQASSLERYCGGYYTYFRSPNFSGGIIKGFAKISIDNNMARSKVLDMYFWRGARSSATARINFYKMNGHVTLFGDYIYILDQKVGRNPSYTMTCLHQSYGEHVRLLSGLMMGVTYHSDRRPFSTNIAYEAVDRNRPLLSVIRECGVYDETSVDIPREVKRVVRNVIDEDLQILVSRGM